MGEDIEAVRVCGSCNLPEEQCLCENPIDLEAERRAVRRVARAAKWTRYIGDGVNARVDRWGRVILSTPRYGEEHSIILDPEVWMNLTRFIDDVQKEITDAGKDGRHE